jgi:hypothetical protein
MLTINIKKGINMMYRYLLLIFAILAMTGCASVVNETTHSMKVETVTSDNTVVNGAECKLTNDRESVTMKSGSVVMVRRSADDMEIACIHPNNPALKAVARAISRANGGMYGNILLGGVIGAVIDHNKGTAYTYPTWVQLVFGKDLIFDRTAQKEVDKPTPASNSSVSEAVVVKHADEPKKDASAQVVVDQPKEKLNEQVKAPEEPKLKEG